MNNLQPRGQILELQKIQNLKKKNNYRNLPNFILNFKMQPRTYIYIYIEKKIWLNYLIDDYQFSYITIFFQ